MNTPFTTTDSTHMARAIELARRGLYTTMPNPRVGCVIAHDEEVVGEGWHQQTGSAHAEVEALAAAGVKAKGATAYVTLEPCSHHGRTPPCIEALIQAGVSRVVAAMVDPNPQVAGRGLRALNEAGIKTDVGLLEAEARALNPGFIKRMETGKPYLRCKLAMSLDGRTAMKSGKSQWITGEQARADVQRLRAQSSAIISGIGSILQDNSALTVRPAELLISDAEKAAEQQPLRVVVDSKLRLPANARVLHQRGETLVVTAAPQSMRSWALQSAGAEIITLAGVDGQVDLEELMLELGRRQCNEVLLETGAELAGAALAAGLIDELVVYMAPVLMGSEARPLFDLPLTEMSEKVQLQIADMRAVGADMRITAYPVYSPAEV